MDGDYEVTRCFSQDMFEKATDDYCDWEGNSDDADETENGGEGDKISSGAEIRTLL